MKGSIRKYFSLREAWTKMKQTKIVPSIKFIALCTATASVGAFAISQFKFNSTLCENGLSETGIHFESDQVITNWSNTHGCRPFQILSPQNAQEVCRILKYAHDNHLKIRPVGTALSPNGIGLSQFNLLSVASIDYVEVNKEQFTVTVGAGARVSDVLKRLGEEGLTLENFSSIQEQQVAGWTQVRIITEVHHSTC